MKTLRIFIITLILLFFNLLIMMFPESSMQSARSGALLWYRTVLPSLFPFIFGINMLMKTNFAASLSKISAPFAGKLFRISGAGALAYISGISSGYPVGAKITCNMLRNKMIEKDEAQRLITFCNNSGPLFIIGTLGTLFSDIHYAYVVLIIHILSSFITGLLFRNMGSFLPKENIFESENGSFAELFSKSITDAGETVIKICGYIIIFSVISGLISKTGAGNSGIIMSLLEMTNGCSILAENGGKLSRAAACAAVSWGGLSIHAQTFDILGEAGLSKKLYVTAKMIQSALSFLIFYGAYGFFC